VDGAYDIMTYELMTSRDDASMAALGTGQAYRFGYEEFWSFSFLGGGLYHAVFWFSSFVWEGGAWHTRGEESALYAFSIHYFAILLCFPMRDIRNGYAAVFKS
jgi:hypothetical protein